MSSDQKWFLRPYFPLIGGIVCIEKWSQIFVLNTESFLNLHIQNPRIKSDNLAKTESLLIFVLEKLASGFICTKRPPKLP